jgi:glutathione S-transferase
MKIYGDHRSGNCLKVKWTAEQVGAPFDWVEVDVMSGRTRREDFLAINPAGQVPAVILADGRALAQSNAIMLHLAETHGGGLIPTDAFARAKMYEWMFWEQYSHETAIAVRRFLKHFLKKADSEIDPRLMDKGRAALALMESRLSREAFIAGPAFTLADIALLAYTRVAHEGGFDLDETPYTKQWVARIDARLGLAPAP